MFYQYKSSIPKVHPTVYCAPSSQIIGEVFLKENCTVWFNAVLRADDELIKVGKNSNIQDGTVIHVDVGFPVIIGENVTVGHNVTLHGCTVEDGALIGMGATVLNGAKIGKGSFVAAGALVPEGKVVEPGTLVAGVPAKSIREIDSDLKERIKSGVKHYVQRGQLYKKEMLELDMK